MQVMTTFDNFLGTNLVVTSHTSYWIHYAISKKNVVELNNNITKIKSATTDLINGISSLKEAMENSDFRSKNADLTSSLNTAVESVSSDMNKLSTAVANRLEACAKTDAWFGSQADTYASYIRRNFTN